MDKRKFLEKALSDLEDIELAAKNPQNIIVSLKYYNMLQEGYERINVLDMGFDMTEELNDAILKFCETKRGFIKVQLSNLPF